MKTFKGYDDYSAASVAAKYAVAADHGLHWHRVPGASVSARVPAAWVACKVYGRVSRSPRDVRLPAARYWPNGRLPDGPVYFPDFPREPAFVNENERRKAYGLPAFREAA